MLVIVDFGLGNLRSILNKLQKSKTEACISSKYEEIEKAEKLILPGVGHFASGMINLKNNNLINILTRKVLNEKTPILGICLGMQLFTRQSEEGNLDGLGWINTQTKKFDFSTYSGNFRIPHVGWNTIEKIRTSPLLEGIPDGSKFYYTHSYHLASVDSETKVATTYYGYNFISVFHKGNIYGTQFHPEKSHKVGMKLIKNFIRNC